MKYAKAIASLQNMPASETDAEPLTRSIIPLDSDRLWFLSTYKNKDGIIVKYSFDVEKAATAITKSWRRSTAGW